MGRSRKPIRARIEGKKEVARFLHPVLGRTVRINLGRGDKAVANLASLNRIFMNETLWRDPPDDNPFIRDQWAGESARTVEKDNQVVADGEPVPVSSGMTLHLVAENKFLKEDNAYLRADNKNLRRRLEVDLGHRVRSGSCPTIREAIDAFLPTISHLSVQRQSDTRNALKLFYEEFGESTEIDEIEGQEERIDQWLNARRSTLKERQGQVITTARRLKIRQIVVRLLEHAGVPVQRKLFQKRSSHDMRNERGPIRFLSKDQAKQMSDALPNYWSNVFRTQVGLGLRPGELPTLKRSDFADDQSTVTLSPLLHLTLKTGSRVIQVPQVLRPMIRKRLRKKEILFPKPDGKPWESRDAFNGAYRDALRFAAKSIGIEMKIDSYIGRRTCASILIREGMSGERVAAILGNSPNIIREHYGRLLSHEVDPSPAAIA